MLHFLVDFFSLENVDLLWTLCISIFHALLHLDSLYRRIHKSWHVIPCHSVQ